MKYEEQKLITVDLTNRIRTVYDMKRDGYRLVAITCTKTQIGFELSYSFDKDYEFVSIRLEIPPETEITSISGVYHSAFIYENELKDLFGVNIKHIVLDYDGNFYKLPVKTPFNPPIETVESIAAKEEQ
jgi:ech hydrogenase subunit D